MVRIWGLKIKRKEMEGRERERRGDRKKGEKNCEITMHIARISQFANLRRLSSYKTPHELLGMNINVDLHVPLYLCGPDMIAFHI